MYKKNNVRRSTGSAKIVGISHIFEGYTYLENTT
jgi:hypothetical protein